MVTLLRELGLVLSEPCDTSYIFKIIIDSFNFFFQRKKRFKLFGQALLKRAQLGKTRREFSQMSMSQMIFDFLTTQKM